MPIVRKEGIQSAMEEWRSRAARDRARYVSQRRFIEDHVPGVLADLDACERHFRIYQSRDRPGIYKVTAHRCHQVPWCIPCVQHNEWKRAQAAIRAIQRCTPNGKQPRFIHIVQTAPFGRDGQYEGGGDWGRQASQNVAKFRKAVWKTVAEMYGGDVGGILSYQDFGEEAFAKRHPHIDMTLNGWMLTDDGPKPVPMFDLRAGGLGRWQAALTANVRAWAPGAEPGHLSIARPAQGVTHYYQALHYQLRELVDIRKLEYDRNKGLIYWHDYQRSRRTKFTAHEFLAGMAEYQWRLKQWPQGEDKEMNLHSRHGHLSDRRIRTTQIAMGGTDPWQDREEWEQGYITE